MSKMKMMANVVKSWAIDHSPELFLVGAASSFVATIVCSSKAAIKAEGVLIEHEFKKDELDTKKEMLKDEYTDQEYRKEKTLLYLGTGAKLVKAYSLTAGFAVATVGCVGAQYKIINKRLGTAMVAAASANKILDSFNLYRQRVINDKGQDADTYYMTGVKPKEITVKNEDGTKEKKKVVPMLPNGEIASPYAFKFGKYKENGERNHQWQGEPILDRAYILGQQDYLNDQLYLRCEFDKDHRVVKRGAVMLNEIRDLMGENPTTDGAVAGNRFSNGEPGCNGYIEFNLLESTEIDPETGAVIPCYWLSPNVDGLIYDLIDKYEEVPFLPMVANSTYDE